MFELSLVRCSGGAKVPRKVIEAEKGAGVWGGLAPIIEVRNSGPPGSGSLRGVESELAPTEPSQTYTYHRSNFVHKNVGFHGQNGISSGFVHKIGGFHGQNRVNRSQ